jgi:hypothetical protein
LEKVIDETNKSSFGENVMYKYYDVDDRYIILHDCIAENMSWKNGTISFKFTNGFWVTPEHEKSTLQQTVRTGTSKVYFHLVDEVEEDIRVYVFTPRKTGKDIRKEWKLKKLIKAINSGLCRLEFLSQYKEYNSQMIECWLWFDKKPYHKECILKISTDKVTYCWNELCSDKPW